MSTFNRYPRCKSLGLIEARCKKVERIATFFRIRGVKASASLKLRRLESLIARKMRIRGVKASASLKQAGIFKRAVVRGAYPRCKSLGLIEASSGVCRNPWSYRIRGVKASASLKQAMLDWPAVEFRVSEV